jgi:cellulose synthase/poly-beta-1,6-N-acetylglucosamine synthase-like glycosyltransferase
VATLAVILSVALGGFFVVQAFMAVAFAARILRFTQPILPEHQCPKAAVVLCLRGADPFLQRCIEALLDQDYPDFKVHVVVDSREDPAWKIVMQVIQDRSAKNIVVESLVRRLDTCSLKCSSLVHAVSSVGPDVEIVAFLDADTIAHRTWLRELAGALADEKTGAATGTRWYMPAHATWGSLVRYVWNAGGVVFMYCFGIAWGGTLALKTKVIREARLLDRWSNSFCEDTMLFSELKPLGYRVSFVPSLIMVNRETCDLQSLLAWIGRQLLNTRLYHPGWAIVVLHGLLTVLLPLAGLAVASWLAVNGSNSGVIWIGWVCLVYEVGLFTLLFGLETSVRRVLADRKEMMVEWSFPRLLKLLLAVPLTQLTYALSVWRASWMQTAEWRGASYQIGGPWSIRLVKEQSPQPPVSNLDSL